MREIKFRGLRTDTKQFVYGYYVKCTAAQLGIDDIHLACARICHVIVVDGMFYHVTDESVGQYTGLKDKNGVEIYEGDIVRVGDKGEVTEVTFFEGCFYTVTGGGNYRCGGWNRSSIVSIHAPARSATYSPLTVKAAIKQGAPNAIAYR